MIKTNLYYVWAELRQRCNNPNHKRWSDYGGRGITVCKEWNRYLGFAREMSGSYLPGLTIDRIDNNGNYCKENCRWTTKKEQANNRRNNCYISYMGIRDSLKNWANYLKIRPQTLTMRLWRNWSTKKALTK